MHWSLVLAIMECNIDISGIEFSAYDSNLFQGSAGCVFPPFSVVKSGKPFCSILHMVSLWTKPCSPAWFSVAKRMAINFLVI